MAIIFSNSLMIWYYAFHPTKIGMCIIPNIWHQQLGNKPNDVGYTISGLFLWRNGKYFPFLTLFISCWGHTLYTILVQNDIT